MRRYLVVANQTLGRDELVELISKRAKAEPCEFFIVVPATPTIDFVAGTMALPVMGGIPAIPDSPAHARELAQQRLDIALAQLQEAGVTVEGRVGHPDPAQAAETVLKGRQFDEIIVSTLPSRISSWLRQDLPRRLEHKCGLPVTHIGATKQSSR
jgi:nucleotide-binding universal stress UspA family protein